MFPPDKTGKAYIKIQDNSFADAKMWEAQEGRFLDSVPSLSDTSSSVLKKKRCHLVNLLGLFLRDLYKRTCRAATIPHVHA